MIFNYIKTILMAGQNAYAGAGPAISKVLIVCPVTLINVSIYMLVLLLRPLTPNQNWKAEFHKWLGRDRVGVSICDRNTNTAKTFASS